MARKKLTFTAEDGRDAGKKFLITEMSAAAVEDWAAEAFFALMGSGVQIPTDVADMGIAGLMTLGLEALGKVPYAQMRPLFARMMECVVILPDPRNPKVERDLVDGDIEEVQTLFKLRKAIWGLHTDFLSAAGQSNQPPAAESKDS